MAKDREELNKRGNHGHVKNTARAVAIADVHHVERRKEEVCSSCTLTLDPTSTPD